MSFARLPLLFALLHIALAEQPSAPSPISAPLRELPWGQLNFLHTTDTHGWHGGHLQEAQYSADWGDYISFAHHLHKRADKDGSDLLLIDTGDRVEGNGLYDASDPKGKYTVDVLKHQQIDVITSGNHELYQANTSNREFESVVPGFKDSYIASNLDIYNPKNGKLEPLARRYRKFTTKNQGIRIIAFGFLFNFQGNANNTVVQPVEKTVEEQWFKDAIRDKEVDLFLVAGHVPVRDTPEFDLVYKTIRDANWDTPIVFFGGHTHIRDYRKWEKKAYGIESGRYMETLGFLSMSGLSSGKKDKVKPEASLSYSRRYIDNNLFSLHHHSGTNHSTFQTELGRNVSTAIKDARSNMKLDHTFGCAPQDYWLNRAPYPSNQSMLTWLENEVLPDTFKRSGTPSIVITNTGAMRFDIFKGPFTTDTTFLVSPFTSTFRKLNNVPYKAATQVLRLLNNEGPIALRDLGTLAGGRSNIQEHRLHDLLAPMAPARIESMDANIVDWSQASGQHQTPLGSHKDQPLIPGYTTVDDAGDDGDDTIHQKIQFYNVPNCIGAEVGFSKSDDAAPKEVDLVYNEFIQPWIILALKFLGVNREKEDTSPALDGQAMTDVISHWIEGNWQCKD